MRHRVSMGTWSKKAHKQMSKNEKTSHRNQVERGAMFALPFFGNTVPTYMLDMNNTEHAGSGRFVGCEGVCAWLRGTGYNERRLIIPGHRRDKQSSPYVAKSEIHC